MAVANIMEHLSAVGLSVAVIEGDRISVSPRELLTDELRDLIRSQREVIVAALKPVELPEPPLDPMRWRELAQAYQQHHFKCKLCIAAGLGSGPRCDTGLALWVTYQRT